VATGTGFPESYETQIHYVDKTRRFLV